MSDKLAQDIQNIILGNTVLPSKGIKPASGTKSSIEIVPQKEQTMGEMLEQVCSTTHQQTEEDEAEKDKARNSILEQCNMSLIKGMFR